MRRLFALLCLAALLGLAAPSQAAPQWQFDPAHCQIIFQVKHIFAPVMGRFQKFGGQVAFSPTDLANSKVELVIDAASLNTDVPARDKHLRSADFFEVQRYPQIRFVSEKFEARGKNRFVVKGRLSMKDVTRPVEIEFTHLGTKPNPMKKGVLLAGFQGRFALERLDYHVGTGKFWEQGLIGNRVVVFIHLELTRPQ